MVADGKGGFGVEKGKVNEDNGWMTVLM